MQETVVETRNSGGAPDEGASNDNDPVIWWRRIWAHEVAQAAAAAGGDSRLVRRRRDYGAYLSILIDLIAAFVGELILSIPLIMAATFLFVYTGHHYNTAAGQREFQTWLASPQFTFFGVFVTDAAILLVLWYRLARLRERWSLFGLGAALRSAPARSILFGLGIGVAALVLSSLITDIIHALGFNVNGQQQMLIQPLHGAPWWIVLGVVLAGTFVAPVVEELFFRGYIFRAVAVRRGIGPAYITSALVFALFHLSGGTSLLPLVPALFVVGLLLCFAYRRTGNLLADITAHALNNGVAFAVALLPLPFHM